MPTGYTHPVQEGKITTLREFAMNCARSFGACINMRDDPADAAIPERFEPHTAYYDEALTKARAILDELPRLSTNECERRATAAHADKLDNHRRYAREKEEHRARYEALLAQVEGWHPPADLGELRKFMLDQLAQSIDFDCSTKYASPEPEKLSGEAWRDSELSQAARDLAYHTEERRKEIERTEDRNRWIALLRKSLA
jgi:hypothetical protein